MNWARCPVCNEFDNLNRHRCPPAWLVWHEEAGKDDAKTVHAHSAKEAAEKRMQEYFDWSAYESTEGVFMVQSADHPDGVPLRFRVVVEMVPEFLAHEEEAQP